jgi:inositol 1,4,5-triphosphate receptor type 1/inositol 1,4,5-triphosphate receptor type 3
MDVCHKISNIGLDSKNIYNTNFEVTTSKEFILHIINMNINNPGFLKDDLRVFFLKMLGRLITEKNPKNK